jgi:hypothetical protein
MSVSFQLYSAVVSLVAGWQYASPAIELTVYEALGLPGHRTIQAYAGSFLQWTGLGDLLGMPSPLRLSELAVFCQRAADNDATTLYLREHGLPHFARVETRFLCTRLYSRGLVTDGVVAPWAVALATPLNVLQYLPHMSIVLIAVVCLIMIVLGWALWAALGRAPLVRLIADRPPLTHREVSSMIATRMNATKIAYGLDDGTGHRTLALVRTAIESACIHVLSSMSTKIRDIGGSLTRHSHLGKKLHICFPGIEAMDKLRLANGFTDNDVGFHGGEDCPYSSRPSIMSYVDFHLDVDCLVRAIRSPTFIITHDFAGAPDKEEWFDGEATVEKVGNHVRHCIRGGTNYFHGYHSWQHEGMVVSKSGAFSYQKVLTRDHSIVLWCVPVAGHYNPDVDNSLTSSEGEYSCFKLSGGITATLSQDKFLLCGPGGTTNEIGAPTVYRVAFQMSTAPRDDKWHTNLAAILRGRFTADQQPSLHLAEAQELCVMLADRMSLYYRRSAIGDPHSYGFISRILFRLIVNLQMVLPATFEDCLTMVTRKLRSALHRRGPRHPLKWMWVDIKLPTYEVFWDQVMTMSVEARKAPRQPFPVTGAAAAAPPPVQSSSPTSSDGGKPDGGDRKTSVRRGAQTPPPVGGASSPAGPSSLSSSSEPDDPAHLPATTKANPPTLAKQGASNSAPKKGSGRKSPLASKSSGRGSGRLPVLRTANGPHGQQLPTSDSNKTRPVSPDVLANKRQQLVRVSSSDAIRAVGSALHASASAGAARRKAGSAPTRLEAERRNNGSVHKGGNQHKRHRSKEHQSASS